MSINRTGDSWKPVWDWRTGNASEDAIPGNWYLPIDSTKAMISSLCREMVCGICVSNCESVPRLPAIIIRYFFESEEMESCSLVWRWMHEHEIQEGVTLRRMTGLSQVELRRANGKSQVLALSWHSLPRNGGMGIMVVCPRCGHPRRFF